MICRECANAVIENTKDAQQMAQLGYKSCAAASNAIERAKYFTGGIVCCWPSRFVPLKKKENKS